MGPRLMSSAPTTTAPVVFLAEIRRIITLRRDTADIADTKSSKYPQAGSVNGVLSVRQSRNVNSSPDAKRGKRVWTFIPNRGRTDAILARRTSRRDQGLWRFGWSSALLLAELKPSSAKDVDVDAGSGHRRGGRRYTADEDPASASSTVARPTAPSTLDIPSTSRPACAWSDRSGVNHLRLRVRSCNERTGFGFCGACPNIRAAASSAASM